jgi:hypothetical protein
MAKDDRKSVKLDKDSVYLVNPKGVIHLATREHARERLRNPGWHVASKEEIAAYETAGGHQSLEKPAGRPAVAATEAEPALPDEALGTTHTKKDK